MKRLLRLLGLRGLAGFVATAFAAGVFAVPLPVQAYTPAAGCIYEGGSPTTPTVNIPSLFECDANRNVLVSGTVTAIISGTATVGIDQVTANARNVSVCTSTTCLSIQPSIGDGYSGSGNSAQTMGFLYGWSQGGADWNRVRADGDTFDNPAGTALHVTDGGALRTILTSASATSCTNLATTPQGRLVSIINTGAAMTVYPQFYDDSTATCAAGTLIYGDGSSLTLGAGQTIKLDIPVFAGLSYKLSGALSSNLVIVRN